MCCGQESNSLAIPDHPARPVGQLQAAILVRFEQVGLRGLGIFNLAPGVQVTE